MQLLSIFFLVILQNASFTLVSRARNSDSILFHAGASVASNGIWIMVMGKVITNFKDPVFIVTYIVASVTGSILMHYISMKWLEKIFAKKAPK